METQERMVNRRLELSIIRYDWNIRYDWRERQAEREEIVWLKWTEEMVNVQKWQKSLKSITCKNTQNLNNETVLVAW